MCTAEIQDEGSGESAKTGEREIGLVHLQLVPVDSGKDYTRREREREGGREEERNAQELT